MSVKRWVLPELDKEAAAALAEQCNLPPFLAILLTARGLTDPETVEEFLSCKTLSDDPFSFADMDAAVARVQQAIDTGEPILIFGDYDADGITATVLLYLYLKSQNACVEYYIPRREEGYGLNSEIVRQKAAEGVSLIITVDNGIAANEETALANSLGVDVVITDHHQPQETLPPAVAVVNPHRKDCGSMCKDYAGVGVVFKLVCALDGDEDKILHTFGDLVALGTLADVMPLLGENRVLVGQGLARICQRPGVKALLEAAGVSDTVSSTSAVFTLSPRINAAGRMGSPLAAAKLLLSETEEEAKTLAAEIQAFNSKRQATESTILEEVNAGIDAHPEWLYQRVLVLQGENWHHGVIGIIASRMLEKYGKPCIVLSVTEGHAKGSGRSLPGFSLFEAVSSCESCLSTFGGHELAVGVSLEADRIEEFRQKINAYAAAFFPQMPVPELHISCKLRPSQIDLEKLMLLSKLEPFGAENPTPLFGLFGMTLDNITAVGGGRHLRLTLSRDETRVSAMLFQCAPSAFPVPCGSVVNAVVSLEKNEWHGVVSPSLIIRDIRYADTNEEDLLQGLRLYDSILRGDLPAGITLAPPTREQLGQLYRFLNKTGAYEGTLEQLYHPLSASGLNYAQLRAGVEILRQAGVLTVEDSGKALHIVLSPQKEKADLSATSVMKYLSGR